MAGEKGTSENGKDYRNMKTMDVKMLVDAEHKKKKWEDTSTTGEALLESRGEKTNQYKLGDMNQLLRMALK